MNTKTTIKGDESLGQHIDAVLKTESGRALWAYLFHACGYNASSLSRLPGGGDILPLATECKEAQRLVYINLRKLASRELLVKAEDIAETLPLTIATPIPNEIERKK